MTTPIIGVGHIGGAGRRSDAVHVRDEALDLSGIEIIAAGDHLIVRQPQPQRPSLPDVPQE
jgi:hypothetical protein